MYVNTEISVEGDRCEWDKVICDSVQTCMPGASVEAKLACPLVVTSLRDIDRLGSDRLWWPTHQGYSVLRQKMLGRGQ